MCRPNRDRLEPLPGGLRTLLGPDPAAGLRALADLGLSDSEIARYLGIPRALVAHIRHPAPGNAPQFPRR